ncbi:hypothetical protein LINPERPRIM_LOCUS30335 [Linum perenne]
MSGRS